MGYSEPAIEVVRLWADDDVRTNIETSTGETETSFSGLLGQSDTFGLE